MFTIYCLTLPDGRAYVGLTSQPVHIRWGNGWNYSSNPRFYMAMLECGWQHVKKEELAQISMENEARDLEAILINKLGTYKEEKGFNIVRAKERAGKIKKERREEILKQYGLEDYEPTPIENAMELVKKWQEEEKERKRIEELRKQAQWQMFNWIESINNPLPIYDDPEYQRIFQEELEREKAKEERAKKKRKDAQKAYQARHALSEIEAYEREKWARISQQRATYEKWKGNR